MELKRSDNLNEYKVERNNKMNSEGHFNIMFILIIEGINSFSILIFLKASNENINEGK